MPDRCRSASSIECEARIPIVLLLFFLLIGFIEDRRTVEAVTDSPKYRNVPRPVYNTPLGRHGSRKPFVDPLRKYGSLAGSVRDRTELISCFTCYRGISPTSSNAFSFPNGSYLYTGGSRLSISPEGPLTPRSLVGLVRYLRYRSRRCCETAVPAF